MKGDGKTYYIYTSASGSFTSWSTGKGFCVEDLETHQGLCRAAVGETVCVEHLDALRYV